MRRDVRPSRYLARVALLAGLAIKEFVLLEALGALAGVVAVERQAQGGGVAAACVM